VAINNNKYTTDGNELTYPFHTEYLLFTYIAAYTANLASVLVERSAGPVFQLNTIEDAIGQNFGICIEKSTASEEHMEKKYPQSNLLPYGKDEDMYLALNSKKCDIMVTYSNLFELYELKKEYNPNCTLVWEGREVLVLSQGFATKFDPYIKCSSLVNGTYNAKFIFTDTLRHLYLSLTNTFFLPLNTPLNIDCEKRYSIIICNR
jgi:hypothetical protein